MARNASSERRLQILAAMVLCAFLALGAAASIDVDGDPKPPEPAVLLPDRPYTQDFDGLAAHGTGNPFPPPPPSGRRDKSASLAVGWWSSHPTYSASSGSPAAGVGGGLFSFGQDGSGERALGSVTSNQVRHTAWGLSLTIDEHETSYDMLWALEVAYTGEQWSAGNGSSMLVFDYSVVSKDDYEHGQEWGYYDTTPGLWMVKDKLSFTSPVTGGEERGLNGNDPSNRRALKHTLAVDDWGKGKIAQLRDREGKDHALAIDDLSVTLIPLRKIEESAAEHRKRTWLYVGASVVGAGLLLTIAGLVITLVVKRRRNAHEGEQSYALLRQEGGGDQEFGQGNTSINPVDVAVRMPTPYAMAMPPRPGFPPTSSDTPTFGALPAGHDDADDVRRTTDQAGECDAGANVGHDASPGQCCTTNCGACGQPRGVAWKVGKRSQP